jgi:N-acetylglucosamine-6-phosphate deacetylase
MAIAMGQPRVVYARDYATGEAIAITVESGRIVSRTSTPQRPECWVAPSFFDVQINGCLGIDFGSPHVTVDQIRQVAETCRAHGIGRFCPTIITGSFEAIRHGFATLAAACNSDPLLAWQMPGFHLEGPYLSAEDGPRGAHPREQIRDPDWDEFSRWQEAAGGRIRMVTVAPERKGALEFIKRLTTAGIVAAIGHTAATPEQIRAAIAAGARTSTHLGNGCHAMLPRHPNYLWEQLAADELWASIIPDGHHLPAAVVKSIARGKTLARLLITCDASSLAGMPPGIYSHWGSQLEVVPGGKVVVSGTPYLAGSGVFTDTCVSILMQQAGLTLAEAIDAAAVRPRELLGLPVPTLTVGSPAELIVFDWKPGEEIQIRDWIGGPAEPARAVESGAGGWLK